MARPTSIVQALPANVYLFGRSVPVLRIVVCISVGWFLRWGERVCCTETDVCKVDSHTSEEMFCEKIMQNWREL
ncbi:unnamed protein product [Onchocerca ochengi]|uniref:Uncharacterized protein n=1 Tax=Onchocerca ochengi TaxID=42157 RepID=A0A182E5M1_ONCOC|nr:unnamed protein product [Onchocerca ochengi]